MWLLMVLVCMIQQSVTTKELIRKRHQNPQGFMNISEIIDYWGYPHEEYQILTDDGYFLQVNRIPYGVHNPGNTGHRPVVLLVHGILAEGRFWIANLPNNSLGFFLADAGYDVWILNCRGTTWSRKHQYLSINEDKFWDFDFHEIGIYDIPAAINFILQKTKKDSLYYIAHSQGSTAGLIAFSLMPHLAQKIKIFISFAPGYTLVDAKSSLMMIISLPEEIGKAIWGVKEFRLVNKQVKDINVKLCSYPGIDHICLQVISTITGLNKNNVNVSRADVYVGILPDYISSKTGLHWSQILKTNQFKYYDYGPKNTEFYNMTTPPFYKVEDMNVPMAVFYGGKDILTPKKDIELLLPRIPHLVFQKFIPTWAHLDYVLALDAPKHLYPDVLFLLQQYR